MRDVAAAKPLVMLMILILLTIFPESGAPSHDQEQDHDQEHEIVTCKAQF